MQYFYAPMEGLTDAVARAAHYRCFPGGRPDLYYAPFVSPTKDHTVDPRKLRDILPEEPLNRDIPLVPQILCKQAEDFLWLAQELAAMGYGEVNLNLGCPSGTVTAKGKGAGMLRDPQALDEFLDRIFTAQLPIQISLKTRLGVSDPEEFARLQQIFEQYPAKRLIVHARVLKDFYKNEPHWQTFEQALAQSTLPLCYNGSLNTAAEVAAYGQAHPKLESIMLGRGLIANPGLLQQLRTGRPTERDALQAYMTELYEGYVKKFGNHGNAIRRMKGFWSCLLCLFDDHDALEKQLRRAGDRWEYETVTARIFAQLPLRTDAQNVQ